MSERFLMTPPDNFRASNPINPYMGSMGKVNKNLAYEQWEKVKDFYESKIIEVSILPVYEDLPDAVFATDASLTIGGDTVLANFKYPQRQPEVEHHKRWHITNTLNHLYTPKNNFEGGDVVKFNGELLIGHGFRTDQSAHQEISDHLAIKTTSLELVDPRFYHLDTALSVISAPHQSDPKPSEVIAKSVINYYPGAFSPESQEIIRALGCQLIEVSEQEALQFNLNSVPISRNQVLTSLGSQALKIDLIKKTVATEETDVSEFLKAGGGVKCLTNILY